MRLITKGDDYGFTKAVTLGIIEGIDNGILRNTGLFSNMPAAVLAAELMKGREDKCCFGIDFNLVSGPCVSDPKEIPHLVDENGWFIRSNIRIKDPRWQTEEGRREMFPAEEVYKEVRAQFDKFVELTGHNPGYLNGHSLSYETFREAIHRVSEETGVMFSNDIIEKLNIKRYGTRRSTASKNKTFDPLEQLNKPVTQYVLEDSEEMLKAEYGMIGGHPGYVDAELLSLTSLSLERVRDLEMLTHPDILKMVEDNNVELVTFAQLTEELRNK